jgi:hypothetical protein
MATQPTGYQGTAYFPYELAAGGAIGGLLKCYGTGIGPDILDAEGAKCAAIGAVGAVGIKMLNDKMNLFPAMKNIVREKSVIYKMGYGALLGFGVSFALGYVM